MKKWTYLISGIVIGAIVATAGNAFANEVKSMIGKKVTGEYEVVVNGKALQDKGAVIEGRTNVPVRGITQALGADFKVEGRKIIVTTDDTDQTTAPPSKPAADNKYIGGSKESLEELKSSIENNRIKPTEEGRKNILAEIEILKTSGPNGEPAPGLAAKEKQLKEYDEIIAKATEELRLVNEALAAIEK
ncbi:copper amine oxidase [Paenibacillus dendritiformis]|uniref:copper amine oxidase n=1 Tax=Paenibacillus dendritiformis TaxID=130049 RepID=UPI00387E1E0F